MRLCKYILIIALLLHCSFPVIAQTKWPSPEVEQMYNQARDYLSQGNIQQAIITYQQAIRIAPDQMLLYRDLGKAYFLGGNYKEAQRIRAKAIIRNASLTAFFFNSIGTSCVDILMRSKIRF